jgi:hypothetical protein
MLKKRGKPEHELSSFRPIALTQSMMKAFEMLTAARMKEWYD